MWSGINRLVVVIDFTVNLVNFHCQFSDLLFVAILLFDSRLGFGDIDRI